MWKCPSAKCIGGEFRTATVTHGLALLSPDGEAFYEKQDKPERIGYVVCHVCDARAEWIDARQVEMFPVAPTLEVGA